MSYRVFALKYRPGNLDEVVGQTQVVTSLKNAILNKRLHHAYLFSGPRGVGKTSLARILAKSFNCSDGPTLNPCGRCVSCVEIAKGRSLDVIEIDGASNRGIDEIRTLRENVKLSTVYARYKIYIIDEVHMLTSEAFNALLKTLEEPPPHVKFIFATTHPHKILPTILSRCQKFQFNLISLENIVAKLKKIIDTEKIEIEENLLYTIGRAAGGSIRDAESLLDQLVPMVLEKESLGDVFSFLGIIDEDSLNRLLKYLIEKDLSSCLDFVDKIVKSGKDLDIFLNAFIEHLRNLLLAKVSIASFKELSDISPQSKDFILALSKQVTTAETLKVIDSLLEAKDLSRRLNTVRVPLELVLIKFAYEGKLDSCCLQEAENLIERPKQIKEEPSNSGVKEKTTGKPEEISEKPFSSGTKEIDDFDLDIDDDDFDLESQKPEAADKNENEHKNTGKVNAKSLAADDVLLLPLKAKWKEIILYIQKNRAAIASHLSFSKPISSQGPLVTIAFSPEGRFHKESLESDKNVRFIEEAVSKFIGKPVGIRFVFKDLPGEFSEDKPRESKSIKKENENVERSIVGDSDFLNEILDTFEGRIHTSNE